MQGKITRKAPPPQPLALPGLEQTGWSPFAIPANWTSSGSALKKQVTGPLLALIGLLMSLNLTVQLCWAGVSVHVPKDPGLWLPGQSMTPPVPGVGDALGPAGKKKFVIAMALELSG